MTSADLEDEDLDEVMGEQLPKSKSGVKELLESANVSLEKLPMLEVVYDRLTRSLATSLRNLVNENVEIAMESINNQRFGEYLDAIRPPCIIAIFKAEEWDNFGMIMLDGNLVFGIVDLLLGGKRGGAAPMRVDGRTFTVIEQSLIQKMVQVVLNDLSVAFDPISAVHMNFDRLETTARFAPIARPNNAANVAKFTLEMDDRGGKMDIVLPFATLEPVRELLLQMFMGEKFGRDSIWETHLAQELWHTDLVLDAVLDERKVPLGEVLNWEVGSFYKLDANVDSMVQIRSGGIPIFTGELGRRSDFLAVKLRKRIVKE